jgi:hypothetical protein
MSLQVNKKKWSIDEIAGRDVREEVETYEANSIRQVAEYCSDATFSHRNLTSLHAVLGKSDIPSVDSTALRR